MYIFHANYTDLIPEGVVGCSSRIELACTTDETKLWLYKSVCETAPESLFYGDPNCHFSMSHDWPVKKAIVDLPI